MLFRSLHSSAAADTFRTIGVLARSCFKWLLYRELCLGTDAFRRDFLPGTRLTGRESRNTYGGNPSHLDIMNGMTDERKDIRFTALPSPVLVLGFPEDFYWHEHIHVPFKCDIPILLLIPQLPSKPLGY